MKKMINLFLVCMMIVTSCITFVLPVETVKASRTTYYVGGSGPGNYTNIQSAIDDSSPGDTVFVYIGTYYENVIIKKDNLILISEDKNNTIIDSRGTDKVIAIEANNTVINGFTLQNGSYGVMIYSNNNNKIIENIISNTTEDGINLYNSNGNQISFNILKDNNDAIELWNLSNDNTISNNHIIDNNYEGIAIHSSNTNIISNNIIINSVIGINIIDSKENQIMDNIVNSNKINGINLNNSSINTIVGNTAYSNKEIGIILDNNSYNNTVTDCIANDNAIGIAIWNSSYNQIIGSYTADNVLGIILINSSKNKIINNEANNNSLEYDTIPFFQGPPAAGILFGQSSQNTLIGNSCSGNTAGISMFNLFNESRHKPYYDNSIDTSNLVNGRPVYYYYDQDNLVIENLETTHLTLAFCENCVIRNCNVSDGDGINLWSSNDNIIEDSVSSNNALGILLHGTTVFDSVNNVIKDCKVFNNYYHGIILNSAHGSLLTNTVINCEISNNGYIGLTLQDTFNNNIINNKFTNDGLFIISETLQNFIHNIENNSVNNKPLLYYLNQSNLVIDEEDIGQILLVNCTNSYLNNLNISDTDLGILSAFSKNISINNSCLTDTLLGIYVIKSSNHFISNCSIFNNTLFGIQIMNSSFFNIYSNNFGYTVYGLVSGGVSKCIISKNIFRNNQIGIVFFDSFNNEIYLNNFIGNNQHANDDSNNIWDDGRYGNYWDDYKERYPDAKKLLLKGIWDTPYSIPNGDNQDKYPLIKPDGKSKNKTFTFIDFYKHLISRFSFFEKILNQIIL